MSEPHGQSAADEYRKVVQEQIKLNSKGVDHLYGAMVCVWITFSVTFAGLAILFAQIGCSHE